MTSQDIYYIATPYSDPLSVIREQRFRNVSKFSSILIAGGIRVYSPISHSHPMVDESTGNHILNHEGWLNFESSFMQICSRLIVLCLPGWSTSKGVRQETEIMTAAGKPVLHVIPYNLDNYPAAKDQHFKVSAKNQDKNIKHEIEAAIESGLMAKPYYPFGERKQKIKEDLKQTDRMDFSDIFGSLFNLKIK